MEDLSVVQHTDKHDRWMQDITTNKTAEWMAVSWDQHQSDETRRSIVQMLFMFDNALMRIMQRNRRLETLTICAIQRQDHIVAVCLRRPALLALSRHKLPDDVMHRITTFWR